MNISATSWPIGMKVYLKHHWGGGKASVGFDLDRIRTLVSMATDSSHRVISSPKPSGSQGELIVYPWSGVRRPSASVVVRPHFSNIFSSETAWPIKAKFYVEPPWGGGTKVYINDPGHITKMAATPIYGKNPSKIFFS